MVKSGIVVVPRGSQLTAKFSSTNCDQPQEQTRPCEAQFETAEPIGIPWTKIQEITGRSPDTLNNVLQAGPEAKRGSGAAVALSAKDIDKILKAMQSLLKKADAKREVTAGMILAKAGVTVCDKTLRKAFHDRKIKFYKLKEKPLLEPEDVTERLVWATVHSRRSQADWVTRPHAVIDNKSWQLITNQKARGWVARRAVRGAYQQKGSPPKPHVVKPKGTPSKTKFPSVQVTAAVIKGKVRMWRYVKGTWTGAEAAAMYKELRKVLKKAYPNHKGKWSIIEDNDPTGYKSRVGFAAKKEARMLVDSLPKRSPDLNVLDYSLWKKIDTRMREHERSFRKTKKESKDEFLQRLRKTAMGLPSAEVKKAMGSMRRRCKSIMKERGGLFNE